MKLQINNSVSIEITEPNELIELMSDDEKLELIESLSCHEAVIKHVADQLIHGCTENGNSGSYSYTETPSTARQIAMRELIENINTLACNEIKRLEDMVKTEKENTSYWVDMYHKASRR